MLALEIKPRKATEPADVLRKRGVIPAVFYGPKENATAISLDAHSFKRIWHEAGETTVITLRGVGEEKETLIHDVQFHPVTSVPIHVDFYVLEKGKRIRINVPLVFSGIAPAEKAGHIVVKALHEIEIEVTPSELPHNLPVDISVLEGVGDHIMAGQISLPASAVLLTHANEIVASVTEFKEEKTEEPAPAPATGGVQATAEAVMDTTEQPAPTGVQKEKKEKK